MTRRIDFYFDVISPYSWIGFEHILRASKVWPIDLRLIPCSLAIIMGKTGNTPPSFLPQRGLYLHKDLGRTAEYLQLPMKYNDNVPDAMFKKGTRQSLRLLTLVSQKYPHPANATSGIFGTTVDSPVVPLSHALWRRIWNTGEDITSDESLIQAIQAAGLSESANDWINELKSAAVRDGLDANTEQALKLGAFGMPYTVVDPDSSEPDVYFGSDRLHMIGHKIGQDYPGPLLKHSSFKM